MEKLDTANSTHLEAVVGTEQSKWSTRRKIWARPLSPYNQSAAKRMIDICGALAGLVALFPLLCLIALLIKLADPGGPVFYRQLRKGRHGTPFRIIKFRSMVTHAEERLKRSPDLYRKYVTNNYKLETHEDPRITRIGRLLRKTSLDELPQLVNVLMGDMSLVGPRPVVGEELREYGDRSVELLSVKPGMTGYWQISGRSSVGYPERVDLELYYVYHQSFVLDMKILLRTVWIVLCRRGAY